MPFSQKGNKIYCVNVAQNGSHITFLTDTHNVVYFFFVSHSTKKCEMYKKFICATAELVLFFFVCVHFFLKENPPNQIPFSSFILFIFAMSVSSHADMDDDDDMLHIPHNVYETDKYK